MRYCSASFRAAASSVTKLSLLRNAGVFVLLYMCPHTSIYVSAYYCMRVVIPLQRSCECTESDYQCDFCYERVGQEVLT